jgi:glycosyltransferase involved in cell wall biosynthesis
MTGRVVAQEERRLCILFHESAILGAGVSILRVVEQLRSHGWTSSGWFPGPGPLVAESAVVLDNRGYAEKPIAFSLRGWRRTPGVVQRLRRTPAYLGAFRRWLQQEHPDVVHVNSLLMLPEATVARRLGVPIVMQVHEIPPPGRKRSLTLRWAAVVADALVGVSQPVVDMLAVHAGNTPVLRIHNGVPRVETGPVPEGRFVVGTIGHVSRTKGTDIFLRAAAIALETRPDFRFEHVGPTRPWGDDEYEDEVEATAQLPQLRDAVQMLGQRPAAEALAGWSIFVLPSRQEAFPLSTLEAMGAGIPVIATKVGCVPEQIVHLESGVLVPPEDPAAIAEWIEHLRDDPDLRLKLAAAGRSRVRTKFTIPAQATALAAVYDSLLLSKTQAAPGS